MTRPPAPLTAAQQQELVQQIGQAAAAALPAGWQQLQVVCRAAGRHVEVDVAVLAPDNRTYPVQPHPELPRLFDVLRTGMYQPGRGTWLTATLVFSPQRPPFTDYQPDVEPRWRQMPPPIGFQDELRFFPREDRFVPPWLRQRAGAATPPGAVPGAVPGQPVPPPPGAVPGQPVPPPGASPAVPPPLPGAEQAAGAGHPGPAQPAEQPKTASPTPSADEPADAGNPVRPRTADEPGSPPPLPGAERVAGTEPPAAAHPVDEPSTPPPLPDAERVADTGPSAPALPVDQPTTPPPLPGTEQVTGTEPPAAALPVDEPSSPPPLPGAKQAASTQSPAPTLPVDEPSKPPPPGAERVADTEPPAAALPVDQPSPPPPLPGAEQAASTESPAPALPVDEPSSPPPLPDAELGTGTGPSAPALPVDQPTAPPPGAEPAANAEPSVPPLPDIAQAASASDGDEAQSEPSEVAAAEIPASQGGASAEPANVPAEAQAKAVAAEGESASPAVELRTPRIYDGFDEAGNPVVEREALSPEEGERVLAYLDGAPVILASRSRDVDAFDASRTDAVPLNFRTDGSWVWPGAVAYYLREHGISPDPELVEHIRAAGYTVPQVDEATQERMLAAMTSPPAEESRPSEAAPRDPEQLLGEISAALVAAAPQGWQQIVFDFMTLGRHANLACGARMADGSTQQVPVARELSRPLAELRRGKYVPGRGTWYTLSLVIDPSSNYQASFNEDDEPAFHTPPRPEDYALDQELYPRDEDYLPLWFSARLPQSPQ